MLSPRGIKAGIQSVAIMLLFALSAPSAGCSQESPDRYLESRDSALGYLCRLEDEYASAVGIYTDPDAGGSLFWPSWWLNAGEGGLATDAECGDAPHSGAACLRITWDGRTGDDGNRWQGIVFHDSPTWERKGPGHDLTGAKTLTLWYRVDRLDGEIRFILGHFEEQRVDTTVVVDAKRLEEEGGTGKWLPLRMSLAGRDLSKVHVALQVIFDAGERPPAGGTILDIDDAVFDCSPKVALHLPRSYAVRLGSDFRWTHNSAHVYDAAMAVLAHLARDTKADRRRAGVIINTLDYCMSHDRILMGQLRNAYSAGPIALVPGGAARAASWWDPTPSSQGQKEDYYCVGTTTGNAAWAALAAIEYAHRVTGVEHGTALRLARELMIWIEAQYVAGPPTPGFQGGLEGWVPQTEATYKSTEHNLDVYVAARRYAEEWPEGDAEHQRGLDMARKALRFVELMWDEREGRYLAGTLQDGTSPNRDPGQAPADVNAWAVLVLGDTEHTRRAMDWVERNCKAIDAATGLEGYDFNDDRDGVWWEGTAHGALALAALGDAERAGHMTDQLVGAQEHSCLGGGLPAASKDRLTTGFWVKVATERGIEGAPWYYYATAHTGATAWAALALSGRNPYWGTPITAAPPAPWKPL